LGFNFSQLSVLNYSTQGKYHFYLFKVVSGKDTWFLGIILEQNRNQSKINSYFLDQLKSNVEEFLEIKELDQNYQYFYGMTGDNVKRTDSLRTCLNNTGLFGQSQNQFGGFGSNNFGTQNQQGGFGFNLPIG